MTPFARLRRVLKVTALAAIVLGPAVMRADTVAEALQRGDAAAARRALQAQSAGRKDAKLLEAQLEGMIALRQGDHAKAAQIFRAILQVAPGFEPARMQLVVALQQAGQRQEALMQARRIALTTDDRRLRDALLSEIARERSSKPGGVALRFSLLPSSNITGGSDADTVMIGGLPFTLDPASRKAGGMGVSLGLTAWHSWAIAKEWRATLSASADTRQFATRLRPDETELALRLDFSRRWQDRSLSFGPRAGVLLLDGTEARRQLGVGLAGDKSAGRLWLGYSAELLRQDFAQTPFRDGTRASGWLGVKWAVSEHVTLSAELSALRETAQSPHLAHRDLGLGLGAEARLKGGTILGLDLFHSQNRYDGVYPGFGVARKDKVTSLRLSLRDPRLSWQGVMPEISVTRKQQASNISLHDSWTTDFGLSLVKRF